MGDLCESDRKLIDLVAQVWVDNGGDAEGLSWVWQDLKKRIEEIENEKIKT